MKRTPVISLIGRPNVGKSTIFNRLLKNSYKAIAFDKPGVTRDRHYGIMKLQERGGEQEAILIDTGGFYPEHKDPDEDKMFSVMAEQARLAIEESDIVLIVVDIREGLIPFDESIIDFTRKAKKDFWLIVNKFDHDNQQGQEAEFYKLAADKMFLTSAEHARGLFDLKESLYDYCEGLEESSDEKVSLGVKPNYSVAGKIAIIGAPNAGKSTLLNRFVGSPRAVVSSVAGTTVDPIEGFIDIDFGEKAADLDRNDFHFKKDAISLWKKTTQEIEEEFSDEEIGEEAESEKGSLCESAEVEKVIVKETKRSVMIIDTAGIRRKSHINDQIEAQSVYRSLRAIADSDVVIYMIDADKGLTHQDKKLMGVAIEKGKSLLITLNKIDLKNEVFGNRSEKKEFLLDFKYELPWLNYCTPTFISAKEGWGIDRLKKQVAKMLLLRKSYIATGSLNKVLHELIETNPVSIKGSYHTKLKLKYATMVKATPPTFLLFTNRSKGVPVHYRRYLVNGIRKAFTLENTPIHIVFRKESLPSLIEGQS